MPSHSTRETRSIFKEQIEQCKGPRLEGNIAYGYGILTGFKEADVLLCECPDS